ncbi:hypothetical protein P3TCK_21185 [Photobacterium profundum 3TCK]|uniref:Uncharacterized protein n=1 Tax=Photobacterium profundum 3TCK TaxID=314280 RepID=Q1Z8R9_9GAMM|nr:hypothetical protein P3TCK_21185 [Photobacterium profundum 3TCK]
MHIKQVISVTINKADGDKKAVLRLRKILRNDGSE